LIKIAIIHNRYRQQGGEDTVFEAESSLLQKKGYDVVEYTDDNTRTEQMHALKIGMQAIWSRSSRKKIGELIHLEKPKIAHFHNTFLLISPTAYRACRERGVRVVQTLHNYRLLCPAATFLYRGKICEDCLRKTPPWPAVKRACYQGKRSSTLGVAAMLTIHRLLKTYLKEVDAYIALTEFARQKFIEGGLPANKIMVKPNFVFPDPGIGTGRGGYALFVGRLSPEKGIETLLSAWKYFEGKVPLKIAGLGPLAPLVEKATKELDGVEWLGYQGREKVVNLMKEAAFLVLPSLWYENMPLVLLEAFSMGLPVIASNVGALRDLVESGRTGLLFEPGDDKSLAARVDNLLSNPSLLSAIRQQVRAEYEAKYTAEKNFLQLRKIYDQVQNS